MKNTTQVESIKVYFTLSNWNSNYSFYLYFLTQTNLHHISSLDLCSKVGWKYDKLKCRIYLPLFYITLTPFQSRRTLTLHGLSIYNCWCRNKTRPPNTQCGFGSVFMQANVSRLGKNNHGFVAGQHLLNARSCFGYHLSPNSWQ